MDLVRRHDIEDSVLFDISEHKPLRRKSIKLEPLSPSSSPSLDVSSESDSVQKVPSLDNLYDEASLGGKCVLFSKKHFFSLFTSGPQLYLHCSPVASFTFAYGSIIDSSLLLLCHLYVACLHSRQVVLFLVAPIVAIVWQLVVSSWFVEWTQHAKIIWQTIHMHFSTSSIGNHCSKDSVKSIKSPNITNYF